MQELPDGRFLVCTDRTYPDGLPVRLLLMVDGDQLVASDGGEAIGRLADEGITFEDDGFAAAWRATRKRSRVDESDGQILLRADLGAAGSELRRLADALIGLDSLAAFAPRIPAAAPFVEAVAEHLAQVGWAESVAVRPNLEFGAHHWRPAITVRSARGLTYLQVGSDKDRPRAIEHAYTQFAVADRLGVPFGQRLTVLSGSRADWPQPTLPLLATVSVVGFWDEKDAVLTFLQGQPAPADHLLTRWHTPPFPDLGVPA